MTLRDKAKTLYRDAEYIYLDGTHHWFTFIIGKEEEIVKCGSLWAEVNRLRLGPLRNKVKLYNAPPPMSYFDWEL